MANGCIVANSDLQNFLRVIRADQEGGQFVIGFKDSTDFVSFLGLGEEWVIGPSAVYFTGGQPHPLAAGYTNATGRGACTVI